MYRVKAGEAAFLTPFQQRLEYNPPAHGTWNIVHMSMLVPDSHSIYVCSDNCMRGVVMTAAEMGCMDRFSCVTIREMDVMRDNLESITIEGCENVLTHLAKKPKVVFVFLVCLHIFVASDESFIFKKLRERFPEIVFVRCYMDCIRQRTGPSPDMKLRGFLYEPVTKKERVPERVNLLGCDLAYPKDSQLLTLCKSLGFSPLQLQDCKSYERYQSLGEAALNICSYANGQEGIRSFSERIGADYLYLPPAVSYEEIRGEIYSLAEKSPKGMKGLPGEDWFEGQERLCEGALSELRRDLSGVPVSIDGVCHQRPLGLARLFLSHGIAVKRLYIDFILEEERPAYDWLLENAPDLEIFATVQPEMIRVRGEEEKVLALGQKAAWFEQSPYFVNMIESGGLWGYEGILLLCLKMRLALIQKKDLKDVIPRKGMGWPSLCSLPKAEGGERGCRQ